VFLKVELLKMRRSWQKFKNCQRLKATSKD